MSICEVKIKRIRGDGSSETLCDGVAADTAVCIFVNGEFYRTLIASPDMLRELVVGHLYTEGVITSPEMIAELSVNPERVDVELREAVHLQEMVMGKARLLTTACSASMKINLGAVKKPREAEKHVDFALVQGVVDRLNRGSTVFRETGGTHSALVYHRRDGVVAFAEDVGRHNALDKVIGRCLLDGVGFGECLLASSGRLAGEMVLKAAVAGVPVVCSVSAPLASGIRIAEEAGITLIGFVRGSRMNVYS